MVMGMVGGLIVQSAYAQDGCYNCHTDSLAAVLRDAKTDEERIQLLKTLVDLKIFDAGSSESIEREKQTREYLQELIELSSTHNIKDIEAYKALQKASHCLDMKDYKAALVLFTESVRLFDKTKKKIPRLIAAIRYTFNAAGEQEERLRFYSEKLQYYLINGPVENVAPCYHGIGGYYLYKADYNKAISNYLKGVAIFKQYDDLMLRNGISVVAKTYVQWGNYKKALEYFNIVLPLSREAKDYRTQHIIYNSLADINLALNNFAKAVQYSDSTIMLQGQYYNETHLTIAYIAKAMALLSMNQLDEGLNNLNSAKKIAESSHIKIYSAAGAMELEYGFYRYYLAVKKYEEAAKYLVSAFKESEDVKSTELQLKYLRELSLFYGSQHNASLADKYNRKFHDLTDDLEKSQSNLKVAQYENEAKEIQQNENIQALKQQAILQSATIQINKTRLWGSLIALALISISLFFVYRQFQLNKRTLLSLRKTQRQLVMSEKMASLGELTAGIAHEIQNPLNFVNNFSEINTELIDELELEAEKGNLKEVKSLAKDIKGNEQKINHHGKRADAIVKGMLQHSRSSNGVKEPTDINALADEYLRLAYHGLRARDKSFNATMKTNFDESIGKINIIPQDIGRVILNLITNAFYAVQAETRHTLSVQYEPTVWVTTEKIGNQVIISVKDNGTGIPEHIRDKIFQPFFTTKPAGEGTGLGLSLSYDIIRAHEGKLEVSSDPEKGSTFTIILTKSSTLET